MRRVLVTGASGFIGGAVVRRLLAEGTYSEVWGLCRTQPQDPRVKWLHADLTSWRNLPKNFEDADVVHAAGLARDGWDSQVAAANLLGTANALHINPAGKFVHISSSSVYELTRASCSTAEAAFDFETTRFYNSYGQSKALAELLVSAAGAYRSAASVILRPHGVYGKGDTTLLPRLKARVRNNFLLLPDGGRHLHTLTHIENLTAAVMLALGHTGGETRAYNITDAAAVPLAEAISAHLPAGTHIGGLPTRLLLKAQPLLPEMSAYAIRQLGFERTYDITAAQSDLNYQPTGFCATALN